MHQLCTRKVLLSVFMMTIAIMLGQQRFHRFYWKLAHLFPVLILMHYRRLVNFKIYHNNPLYTSMR